jgi:hypothetical protein
VKYIFLTQPAEARISAFVSVRRDKAVVTKKGIVPETEVREKFRRVKPRKLSGLDVGRFEHRAGERDRPGRRWQRPVANIFHTERPAGRRPPRAGRARSPFHPRTGTASSRYGPKSDLNRRKQRKRRILFCFPEGLC